MIGHYPLPKVKNHPLHRDKLGGGGDSLVCCFVMQNHAHHRHEVGGGAILVAVEGGARSSVVEKTIAK